MFRPRVFAIAVAVASALSLGSGCATVARGFSIPKVEVTSDPAGARVFVDDEEVGRTPVTLKRLAGGTHRLRMESPEGVPPETRSIRVTKEFNSPATWEIAFIAAGGSGLPGFLVDWCAGTAFEYTTERWHVDFVGNASARVPSRPRPADAAQPAFPTPSGASAPPEEPAIPGSAAGSPIDSLLEDIIRQNEK